MYFKPHSGNIHSFYRNLLCILKNFRENRKILAQNREVGQGFLRQCLRGIPVSILRSPHPRVLLLKNSLPPSYGSITWKLFVFFIEALYLNIKDTIFLQTMCVYFPIQGIYLYSSPKYANKMILRCCNWNPIQSMNKKNLKNSNTYRNRVCTFHYIIYESLSYILYYIIHYSILISYWISLYFIIYKILLAKFSLCLQTRLERKEHRDYRTREKKGSNRPNGPWAVQLPCYPFVIRATQVSQADMEWPLCLPYICANE